MPLFLAALMGALVSVAGTLVGRVLVSLGIGLAVFSGVDASITWARDFAVSSILATSAQTVAVASTMKVGVCISILTSALVARMALNGFTSGTITKMVQKS